MTSSVSSNGATTSSSASDSSVGGKTKSATTGAAAISSSSSIFNHDGFLKKLENLTPTQESIQTVALWIIHHKNNHEILCSLWSKRLRESSMTPKQRLALFYLANDVVQNCKRKNARIFQDTFKKHMYEAVKYVRDESIKKNITHVLDVWIDRSIYDKDFVEKLKETLNSKEPINLNTTRSPTPPPTSTPSSSTNDAKPNPVKHSSSGSKLSSSGSSTSLNRKSSTDATSVAAHTKEELDRIIAEFQPKKLCDTLTAFQTVCKEVNLCRSEVEATRLLDITVDSIKLTKDKRQCSKFKVEFENSCLKLDELQSRLATQAEKRKGLAQLLEQSEIFYDAQYNDAKTVSNAYRIYGGKVTAVKRKLEELIALKFTAADKLVDNTDMEMSDSDEPTGFNGSYIRSTSNNSLLGTPSTAIKIHLDPRQNRQQQQPSPHGSRRSDSRDNKGTSGSKNRRERSTTPLRDERTDNHVNESKSSSKPQSTTTPLDFLTKFINTNSSGGGSASSPTVPKNVSPTGQQQQNSSNNLSFIVSSLQKFVNTSSTEAPTTLSGQQYFDAANYHQQQQAVSYLGGAEQQPQQQQQQQTPPPPPPPPPPPLPLPPQPFDMHQLHHQMPPPSFGHMMVPPPPGMPFHQMPPMMIPPPGMPLPPPPHNQLMIDPSSGFPNFMFNQPPPPPPPSTIQISPVHGFHQHHQHQMVSPNKLHDGPPSADGDHYDPGQPPPFKRKYSNEDGRPSSGRGGFNNNNYNNGGAFKSKPFYNNRGGGRVGGYSNSSGFNNSGGDSSPFNRSIPTVGSQHQHRGGGNSGGGGGSGLPPYDSDFRSTTSPSFAGGFNSSRPNPFNKNKNNPTFRFH